ncbi:unnamed protein product, partial [Meganyctiphanes norvegica]
AAMEGFESEDNNYQEVFECSECDFKALDESEMIHHSLEHECKYKQSLDKTDSKIVSKEEIVSLDIFQKDDYEVSNEDGDEDYKEDAAEYTMDSNDSEESHYTTKQIKQYDHENKNCDQVTKKKELPQIDCSFCDFICSTGLVYTAHLNSHRGENPYSCLVCNERYQDLNNLKKHTILVHKRGIDFNYFSCYHCDYRCRSLRTFIGHLLSKHNENSDSQPFSYQCPKCIKGFHIKIHLKNHIRKVHFDRSKRKRLKCPDCDYTTFVSESLKFHMYRHTGEKPNNCPFCEYKCISPGNLKVHLLTHTGEKKHLCNVCGFTYTQKSSLKTHMKIHSNERSYLCTECGYRSKTSGNLLAHMRKHTSNNEKKYKCSECEKSFTQGHNLKLHRQKVHTNENYAENTNGVISNTSRNTSENGKKYKCNECEKSFTQGHNLKLHKQKNHTNTTDIETNTNIMPEVV